MFTIVCLPFPAVMKKTVEPGILRRTRLPLSKSPRLFHLSWREIQISPATRLPISIKKSRKNHHYHHPRRIDFPIFSTDLKSKIIPRAQPPSVKHLKSLNLVLKDPHLIGKNYALKKYDQFTLNTGSFFWKYQIKYYPSCAISRHFCSKIMYL